MASTATFRSPDGTALRSWTNDGAGPPVVLANGLGSVPAAWPGLLAPDCGYRVLTWYQRGTFGSERPADPSRVRVQDHVDDLVALMDARGLERALLASWSLGVVVASEAARQHPDRVAGVLAVAGVPGEGFAAVGGPLLVPRALRHPLAHGLARTTGFAGPLLGLLTPRLPVERTAWLLRHSGVMSPAARPEHVAPLLREFLAQDWRWYMHLAVASGRHPQVDLADVRCPVTFVAGRSDVLTALREVLDAAERVPHATVTVLPGSHFLPLEQPERVREALDALRDRSDLAP